MNAFKIHKLLVRSKSTYRSEEDIPDNEKDRCKYPEWEVALRSPDRVNIPCLMYETCLCQTDVKMTNN